MAATTLGHRLRTFLASSALTTAELAEAAGASEDTVGRVLRRLAQRSLVTRLDGAKPYKWGLVAR